MTQQGKLEKLIEQAIERGWDRFYGDKWFGVYLSRAELHIEFRTTQDGPGEYISANDLFFGDNLSFIKALFGDAVMVATIGKSGGFEADDFWIEWTEDNDGDLEDEAIDDMDKYRWAAQKLVIKTDAERIPWLHEQVFSDI